MTSLARRTVGSVQVGMTRSDGFSDVERDGPGSIGLSAPGPGAAAGSLSVSTAADPPASSACPRGDGSSTGASVTGAMLLAGPESPVMPGVAAVPTPPAICP